MIENDNNQPEFFTVFLCFIIALFGGAAKELSKEEESFSWTRLLKNIFISGFCGILIGLLSPDFEHKNWVLFAAGIAGFGGVRVLDCFYEVFKNAITKAADKRIDK